MPAGQANEVTGELDARYVFFRIGLYACHEDYPVTCGGLVRKERTVWTFASRKTFDLPCAILLKHVILDGRFGNKSHNIF